MSQGPHTAKSSNRQISAPGFEPLGFFYVCFFYVWLGVAAWKPGQLPIVPCDAAGARTQLRKARQEGLLVSKRRRTEDQATTHALIKYSEQASARMPAPLASASASAPGSVLAMPEDDLLGLKRFRLHSPVYEPARGVFSLCQQI